MDLPTLDTARLRLRPFADDLSDTDAFLKVVGDSISMRWYPSAFDRDMTRRWIERQLAAYEADGVGLLVIEDKQTGELLGDCGPHFQDVDGARLLELGWHVLRSRQGQGIATEAGEACRAWAFEAARPPFLISLIRPENIASRRVAEKLGFDVWEGTLRVGWGHIVYRLDAPPDA